MDTGESLEDVSSMGLGSESGSDDEGESSSGASDDDDDAEEEGMAPQETVHAHQGPEKDVVQNDAMADQMKLTSAFRRVIQHITNKNEKESSRRQAFQQGTISMFRQLQEVLSIGGADIGKTTKRSLLDH
jgi:hypothetical protein